MYIENSTVYFFMFIEKKYCITNTLIIACNSISKVFLIRIHEPLDNLIKLEMLQLNNTYN